MRQIVLDTETTGLEPQLGHKIIEIGCVELVNRKLTGKHYHQYIKPEREIDQGAIEVHGITNEFLEGKPIFSEIVDDFLKFVGDAELVIHNAPFDIGFLDHEITLLNRGLSLMAERCSVLDTLIMARKKHPGQKNNLDALCRRYFVDNSQRDLHGALLDAEILADVYLLMSGGQTHLGLSQTMEGDENKSDAEAGGIKRIKSPRAPLKVIRASAEEIEQHNKKLSALKTPSGEIPHW